MVRGEAAFAEADCEGGFAAAGVADADEFGDVVPGEGRHALGSWGLVGPGNIVSVGLVFWPDAIYRYICR